VHPILGRIDRHIDHNRSSGTPALINRRAKFIKAPDSASPRTERFSSRPKINLAIPYAYVGQPSPRLCHLNQTE
jgi:hypothetical protein